jgi:hypothetical protein
MSSNSPNNPFDDGGISSSKGIVSITNDVTKEMIAGIINKCTKNERIDDDSKIIISNVLPSLNFHHDTYSPEKRKCHLQYIIVPKLKKGMPLHSLKHLMGDGAHA